MDEVTEPIFFSLLLNSPTIIYLITVVVSIIITVSEIPRIGFPN